MDNTEEYKVFISYAWTNPEHEKWVDDLAKRLTSDGIEVKYDKWDLKVGQDKYAFMESMVTDESINKVLLICDSGYKAKADDRAGGVGTETQIITSEIYDKVNQEKFIPIIALTGEKFDSYMPVYLKSRIGIDLSSIEVFESGYEQLIRTIAERPLHRRPVKGKLPSYLFEEEKPHFKTSNINKQISNCIFKNPKQAKFLINDFVSEFLGLLGGFRIESKDFKEPYDEMIYNNIMDMTALRNDYINFLSLICMDDSVFDLDIVINFFEDVFLFSDYHGSDAYKTIITDHYKFFITELFLYTTAILIDKGMFKDLHSLLHSRFFVKQKYDRCENGIGFEYFRFYIPSLDEIRNYRLGSRRVSITADLIIQRSTIDSINYKEKLLVADLILYYISRFNNQELWFPTTYIYNDGRRMDILKKLVSTRHFEKVKVLFGVETKDEMKLLIEKNDGIERGYKFGHIPSIKSFINPESLCTYA